MLNARNAASPAAEYKIARTQFRRTHEFVRLVTSSELICVTPLPISKMMFGTNQTNVNTKTKRVSTVPAIRHRRCSGGVFKPETKVVSAKKPSSGVTKIQNLSP